MKKTIRRYYDRIRIESIISGQIPPETIEDQEWLKIYNDNKDYVQELERKLELKTMLLDNLHKHLERKEKKSGLWTRQKPVQKRTGPGGNYQKQGDSCDSIAK